MFFRLGLLVALPLFFRHAFLPFPFLALLLLALLALAFGGQARAPSYGFVAFPLAFRRRGPPTMTSSSRLRLSPLPLPLQFPLPLPELARAFNRRGSLARALQLRPSGLGPPYLLISLRRRRASLVARLRPRTVAAAPRRIPAVLVGPAPRLPLKIAHRRVFPATTISFAFRGLIRSFCLDLARVILQRVVGCLDGLKQGRRLGILVRVELES
mmetsp:Transcript_6908/g.20566  ORF Transcript_6908/g.20566 Transcript_6908/m.20566 type:complete len:213 (-) Transcript_6908:362-1000(-)